MFKYTILTVALVVSHSALFAVESFNYREGSSDKFFVEQIRNVNNGTLQEKIAAIDILKKAKTKRALRPLILALKGVTTNAEPTKKQTQEISQKDNYTPINFDIPDNNKPIVKFLAAQALAEIGHELAIKPLAEAYKVLGEQVTKDKEQRIYYAELEKMPAVVAAGEVLRSLGYLLDSTDDKESFDIVVKALDHEHYYIRAAAAEALRNTNKDAGIAAIDTALGKEKDDYARTVMLGSVVGIKKTNSAHLFKLLDMLKNASPEVRIKTSSILGELGIASSETYLRQAMMIEDNLHVRDQIRKDIGIITGYQIPNAPSASYNTSGDERDRNKKSDDVK